MSDAERKFEQEDIPKVLAALKTAHDAKQPSRVTVDFSAEGGILSIQLESKRKFK